MPRSFFRSSVFLPLLCTFSGELCSGHFFEEVGRVGTNVGKTVKKAAKDTGREVKRGLKNTEKTLAIAAKDTGRELVNAGEALVELAENQARAKRKKWTDFERRIAQGKIADAVAHLGIDQIRSDELNLAKAAQKSAILRAAGQTVATVYAGPGGAAAFTAWYTYRSTGDLTLAIKAGLIAAATSFASDAAGSMAFETASDVALRAAVTGAIGGAAVAASGGDSEDALRAFMLGGGSVYFQHFYQEYSGHAFSVEPSEGDPYTKASVDAPQSPPRSAFITDVEGNILYDSKGQPLLDFRKIDPRRPHVGRWARVGESSIVQETSTFMKTLSRLPLLNGMAVFHDQWALHWNMGDVMTVGTIPLAIVMTHYGTQTPTLDRIIKAVQKDRELRAQLLEYRHEQAIHEYEAGNITQEELEEILASKSLAPLKKRRSVEINTAGRGISVCGKSLENLDDIVFENRSFQSVSVSLNWSEDQFPLPDSAIEFTLDDSTGRQAALPAFMEKRRRSQELVRSLQAGRYRIRLNNDAAPEDNISYCVHIRGWEQRQLRILE